MNTYTRMVNLHVVIDILIVGIRKRIILPLVPEWLDLCYK